MLSLHQYRFRTQDMLPPAYQPLPGPMVDRLGSAVAPLEDLLEGLWSALRSLYFSRCQIISVTTSSRTMVLKVRLILCVVILAVFGRLCCQKVWVVPFMTRRLPFSSWIEIG